MKEPDKNLQHAFNLTQPKKDFVLCTKNPEVLAAFEKLMQGHSVAFVDIKPEESKYQIGEMVSTPGKSVKSKIVKFINNHLEQIDYILIQHEDGSIDTYKKKTIDKFNS